MKMSFMKNKKSQAGFTLAETVVAVSMFTILTFVVMESIVTFYKIHAYTLAQTYQIDHARRGIEQLVRDLREMTFADDGTFPLVVMETRRVGFFSDIDRDDSVEYVEYRLASSTGSTTLQKRIYNATGSPPVYSTTTPESVLTISEYVQNSIDNIPIFVYYDAEGSPATASSTVTDIRYVQVHLIVNVDPIRDPGQYELRGSASLRNLKN